MSAEASLQPILEPSLHAELARLRQENHRLTEELASAEASIALQSKESAQQASRWGYLLAPRSTP